MDSNHRPSGITATLRSMYTLVCGLHHPDALPTELNTHFERMCFVNTPSIFLHTKEYLQVTGSQARTNASRTIAPAFIRCTDFLYHMDNPKITRYHPDVVQCGSRIVSLPHLSPPRGGFYLSIKMSMNESPIIPKYLRLEVTTMGYEPKSSKKMLYPVELWPERNYTASFMDLSTGTSWLIHRASALSENINRFPTFLCGICEIF